jgi:DNA-binding XRE family transcriptional regulator
VDVIPIYCTLMKKKKRAQESFGDRLAPIRKSRALTQAELGKRLGVSQRVIAYYIT